MEAEGAVGGRILVEEMDKREEGVDMKLLERRLLTKRKDWDQGTKRGEQAEVIRESS